jgi:predicted ATPase
MRIVAYHFGTLEFQGSLVGIVEVTMLTRLKVSGFKNLVDVDVYFGAFTCIAGANGVGKSNLFDAIRLLSSLADHPLNDAALSVRDAGGRAADLKSLFHRSGNTQAHRMSFEAEMIVPAEGLDDLGQTAKASITFLRYSLELALREDSGVRSLGGLEILKEELAHIPLGDASKHLLFPHVAQQWRKSAVTGHRRVPYFISTDGEGAQRVIKLHQDGGSSGRPVSRPAANLPRTVLSVTNAAESPTALLARREMQSWRLLQLEPSALRRPDEFTAPTTLGMDGSHLPATLYHLARQNGVRGQDEQERQEAEAQMYARVANRLAELISDVRRVWVERDERRELLTLQVEDRDGTTHPARSLSDSSLRFLALAVLNLEPEANGLLCLEEPEHGIHPERIPAMLRLLREIATDVETPIGSDNPLRQVIINTHSPSVVSQTQDDSLIVAETLQVLSEGQTSRRVRFAALPDTWRQRVTGAERPVSKGDLLAYLNPFPPEFDEYSSQGRGDTQANGRRRNIQRVMDRSDLQLLLPFVGVPK